MMPLSGVLVLLSIFSLAFILERFITLGKVKSESKKVAAQISETLQSSDLSEVEQMSRDKLTLEAEL